MSYFGGEPTHPDLIVAGAKSIIINTQPRKSRYAARRDTIGNLDSERKMKKFNTAGINIQSHERASRTISRSKYPGACPMGNITSKSASHGIKYEISAAMVSSKGFAGWAGAAVCPSLPAHFQHESNWPSMASPHFGQVHMAKFLLMDRLFQRPNFVEKFPKNPRLLSSHPPLFYSAPVPEMPAGSTTFILTV
ncbi:MAG TPA: hypothetical protein VGI88_06860 [Verrucomicrobiae bacterium]